MPRVWPRKMLRVKGGRRIKGLRQWEVCENYWVSREVKGDGRGMEP
ncbi:MAG: hypothetical protein H0Z39_00170 [Peptococcaceae bacterium]|nr:hypothetical protein [Peptococcaceae bacterium]